MDTLYFIALGGFVVFMLLGVYGDAKWMNVPFVQVLGSIVLVFAALFAIGALIAASY